MLIRFQTGKYQFRFFDRFDEESRRFEDRLRGEAVLVDSIPWPRISFWQGYRHLQSISDDYFVLQMSRTDSTRSYQLAVVRQASRIPFFKSGVIPYWIPSLEEEARRDQAELLGTMKRLCRERASLMSLRLHGYIPGDAALETAERIMREAGFEACGRNYPARTRLIDLRPPLDEVLAGFSAKVRTKLKLKKPEEVSVAPLGARGHIPELQSALDDSFHRSTAERYKYDFESLFNVLETSPDAAAAFGFFLSEESGAPKAFITGVASPPLFEYTVAGSRSHARLRHFKFNYILLWRLVESAKARGALIFDMGGITDGSPGDPLAGISDFKRRFPGFEVSVGREGLLKILPMRCRLFSLLQALREYFRRPAPAAGAPAEAA